MFLKAALPTANLVPQLSSTRICLRINLIYDSANRGRMKCYLLGLRLSRLLHLLLGLLPLFNRLLPEYHLISVLLFQMLPALRLILRLLRVQPFPLRLRIYFHLHLPHRNEPGSLSNSSNPSKPIYQLLHHHFHQCRLLSIMACRTSLSILARTQNKIRLFAA